MAIPWASLLDLSGENHVDQRMDFLFGTDAAGVLGQSHPLDGIIDAANKLIATLETRKGQ